MANTLARALFIAVSPRGLTLLLFLIYQLSPSPPPPPPNVSSDIVNCAMFADDTTLDTSDTDPVSVENELETGINTLYLTGAAKRLRYYTL